MYRTEMYVCTVLGSFHIVWNISEQYTIKYFYYSLVIILFVFPREYVYIGVNIRGLVFSISTHVLWWNISTIYIYPTPHCDALFAIFLEGGRPCQSFASYFSIYIIYLSWHLVYKVRVGIQTSTINPNNHHSTHIFVALCMEFGINV